MDELRSQEIEKSKNCQELNKKYEVEFQKKSELAKKYRKIMEQHRIMLSGVNHIKNKLGSKTELFVIFMKKQQANNLFFVIVINYRRSTEI